MLPLTVSLPTHSKSYDIAFPDSFLELSAQLKNMLKNSKHVIITDKNVPKFCDWDFLQQENCLALELGETQKCWNTV